MVESNITSIRMENETTNMESNQLMELGVLGILAEESANKRAIRERLQHNFSRYWTASYGALDPAIERLRTANHIAMVSRMTVNGESQSTEYEITEEGRNRLQELLQEPIPDGVVPAQHPEFMLKLGFLHHLPPAEREDQLATLVDQFEQARNRWIDIKATHEEAVSNPPGYRRALQELTIRLNDTYLEWLDEQRQIR